MVESYHYNLARRSRDANRRLMAGVRETGRQTMADQVLERSGEEALRHAVADAPPAGETPLDMLALQMGGLLVGEDEYFDYGLEPAVFYLMNDEESTEAPGRFYSFSDGSLLMVTDD